MASGNRTDISLEDPDFWQKWAKKAELDLDVINGRVRCKLTEERCSLVLRNASQEMLHKVRH